MTAPDTKAIRAQMEALEGFTPGPWSWDEECPDGYSEWYLRPGVLIVDGSDGTPDGDDIDRANAQIIAAAPDMHATIFALCDEVERLSPAVDAVALLVEAARAALNYLENTEGEFGITLGSATDLRAALAAMEASHDRT